MKTTMIKSRYRRQIALLAIQLTCASAIIAGPAGKGFWDSNQARFKQRQHVVGSLKEHFHRGGGYLADGWIPQVEFLPETLELESHPSGTGPTLRSFLGSLEEAEKKAGFSELGNDPAAPTGVKEEEITDSSPDNKDPESLGSSPALASQSTDSPPVVTEPQSQDGPIFPRPRLHRHLEEEFLLYFPLDRPGTGSTVLIPASSLQSTFLPPLRGNMRSTATITQER